MKDASPSRHDRAEARKDKRELPLHTSHGRAASQGMLELQYPQKNTNTHAICIAPNGFASGGIQNTRGSPYCAGVSKNFDAFRRVVRGIDQPLLKAVGW